MARVDLPVTQIALAGVEPPAQVAGDPVNNHKIDANDGRIFIEAENTDSEATHKVTALTPGTAAGVAIEDPAITVAKTSKALMGPFPSQVFGQSTGQTFINVDSNKLKLRAYRL